MVEIRYPDISSPKTQSVNYSVSVQLLMFTFVQSLVI